LTKGPKTCVGEKAASLTNGAEKNRIVTCSRLELDPDLSTCTSINSKWIKDFNVRSKTVKLLQEKIGNTLETTLLH
jgi:hypothetical protein